MVIISKLIVCQGQNYSLGIGVLCSVQQQKLRAGLALYAVVLVSVDLAAHS